ncbi:hypothetical protein FSARC_14394 [Fusarium sarcochroum]|uniref:Uncharacterized protein n=1 Tax=Fusarium sarcochroum TaxID=1208366 RepID=A0A8H4STQ2_9HYPO|nr:hypothetical protein FSARC_14394 [Fusarium sarcochroum]
MTTVLSGISSGMDATKHFVLSLDAVSLTLLTVTLVAFLVPIFILFPPVPVDRSDALRQTHSRAGVALRNNNLRRQSSPDPRAPRTKSPGAQSLHVFPVESCCGIELERGGTQPKGLEYDRLYTFAQLKTVNSRGDQMDSPVWESVTHEQFPLLANVKVDVWVPDPSKTSRLLGQVDGAFLVLRFPWTDAGLQGLVQQVSAKLSHGPRAVPVKELMLPVSFPSEEEIRTQGYSFAEIKIGDNTITAALNMDAELVPELVRYLGVKHQLGIFRVDRS